MALHIRAIHSEGFQNRCWKLTGTYVRTYTFFVQYLCRTHVEQDNNDVYVQS